jgi:hypothetical protein
MEATTLTQPKIVAPPKFKVIRKKSVVRPVIKPAHPFPKVLMPEQPTSYLRQKNNDCW